MLILNHPICRDYRSQKVKMSGSINNRNHPYFDYFSLDANNPLADQFNSLS